MVLQETKVTLTDKDNGKTLQELRIKNKEMFIIIKLDAPPVEQAILVDKEGNINPRVLKIFKNWYHKFAREDKMDPE